MASGASTCSAANPSFCIVIGCCWSWTCTRVAWFGFGVERANVDWVSVCRMFNRAIAGQRLPKRVSTDHDPLFRLHRWLANLRVLAIEEVKSVPYAPVSHPFIERLIGTVRRVRVEDWHA